MMADTTAPPRDAADLRHRSSTGSWTRHTGGILPAYQQANLVVVPHRHAYDFLLFCARNPKPCPVIAVSEIGDPVIRHRGTVADLRKSLPRYRVWQNGSLVDEPHDVAQYWREDAVAFLLGCSLTFEGALQAAGICLPESDPRDAGRAYITNIETVPSGPFRAPLVVTMRPIRPDQVSTVVQISARYRTGHGAPVHIGSPEALGISDLDAPYVGTPARMPAHFTPAFWACGVTPQLALDKAKLDYAITHYPGHMFVFDHTVDDAIGLGFDA